jgi:hypothetical protein
MGLRAFKADFLADLVLLQKFDKHWAKKETQEEGRNSGQSGPNGDPPKHVEEEPILPQRHKQPVEHVMSP